MTVYTSRNPARLPIARSLLAAEAVPFFVRGEALQDLFGLGQMGHGFNPIVGPVEIQVPQGEAERARALLVDLDSPVDGPAWTGEADEEEEVEEDVPTAVPPFDAARVPSGARPLPTRRDRRRFRILVFAYLLVTLGSWFYHPRWWLEFPEDLWAEVERYFEVGDLERTLNGLRWIELPFAVVVGGGLLTFLRPAHHLFVVLWTWMVVINVFSGPGVGYGLPSALVLLSSLLGGAILGLAYFGPIAAAFAAPPRRPHPAPTSPE